MKLYAICRRCQEKVYLTFGSPVFERSAIPYSFSVICPRCRAQEFFSNRDVFAEPDTVDATSGAILGGLIGLLAGPEGAIIGAGLGSMIGAGARENDLKAVRRFNQS